jgi:hypothetical protein
MKLSRHSILVVLSLGAAALAFTAPVIPDAAAQAARAGYKWETHKNANVKFEVPTAWTTTVNGDVLETKPKDGGLAFEFIAIANANDTKAIAASIDKEIQKRIPDAHVTEPAKPIAQNGLSGALVKGEGTKGGKKVEFFALVLGDGKGHAILSVGFAGVGQIAAHKAQVVEIFNSIRPIS